MEKIKVWKAGHGTVLLHGIEAFLPPKLPFNTNMAQQVECNTGLKNVQCSHYDPRCCHLHIT